MQFIICSERGFLYMEVMEYIKLELNVVTGVSAYAKQIISRISKK